jgi:hypothetical protein
MVVLTGSTKFTRPRPHIILQIKQKNSSISASINPFSHKPSNSTKPNAQLNSKTPNSALNIYNHMIASTFSEQICNTSHKTRTRYNALNQHTLHQRSITLGQTNHIFNEHTLTTINHLHIQQITVIIQNQQNYLPGKAADQLALDTPLRQPLPLPTPIKQHQPQQSTIPPLPPPRIKITYKTNPPPNTVPKTTRSRLITTHGPFKTQFKSNQSQISQNYRIPVTWMIIPTPCSVPAKPGSQIIHTILLIRSLRVFGFCFP